MNAPTTTHAIASLRPGPADAADSFVEVEVPIGDIRPHDLLVEVRAVSVNPVDHKVRSSFDAADSPKILGFDAAGTVVAVGDSVSRFAVGDDVFYAGVINRSGSNAAFQLVDEHIVAAKPTSLSFGDAAALPLTGITAWETLFERLRLTADSDGVLLVVGGAGGVGSMIIQLARALTSVTVIATASRPESSQWATDLGAHHIVDPKELGTAVPAIAPDGVDHIFSPYSAGNVETYAEILGVGGAVVAIDEPEGLDLLPLKSKSQTWHWELMFSRPLYTPTDDSQHRLLTEIARLVDAGTIRSTATTTLSPIGVETLREAHTRSESGTVVGKIVIVAE
ncbi:zinc-binding alcohol dehydrogenase family protein [Williamsia maris]|uniref:Zinc-type alcohol dehydrogenase-like protein n=1 Tax=Williamsia maris TaxID=72806 RepID=A0ABT1HG26_9NOCA|nr:zinc-binding alcohol dehydrogenase family protein [Williamsia maris]MCP2177202.1 zinc-binding alcohol dehydrogenase family protein [Williamsia maris]